MARLLVKIPYAVLIPIALVMLLAQFTPMPHVIEKLIMLQKGTLLRPLDIFDLLYHLVPLALLIVKLAMDVRARKNR